MTEATTIDAELAAASAAVHRHAQETPRVGLVLGSGLGAFGDELEQLVKVSYDSIPHMAQSTVVGHAGNLCLGRVGEVPVACLQGRVHCYEGHALERVVFGVRLLAELGCRAVLLTNAAGGIAEGLSPGDLMLIVDHINLMGRNPLVGPNQEPYPRFPDMSRAYDVELCHSARQAASIAGVELREGVYAGVLGPSYETPAEIRMLRTLGADAVGMSTVPEVIALRHRGVRVGALSCITNLAAGLGGELSHDEVKEVADRVKGSFTRVLRQWVLAAGAGVSSQVEG
ncbi:MAG: purine-nucleoside phosphorylase [Myxococcales bacterium]|nr:purine-nucleoside phosphorylase [Myxococcales bacterium]